MKNSDKPYVILGSLLLVLILGIPGFLLWILVTVFVLAMPSNTKPPVRPQIPVANKNSDQLLRLKAELEAQADAESDPQVALGLRRAADIISKELDQSIQSMVEAPTVTPQQVQPAVAAKPHEPLDQIVLMLYVGAFLLLGGMSLFIVYGGLADSLRLAMIVLMALAMYVGGLVLFSARAALRPAGVAFLGIGLVMIPLSGYAAVYLTNTDPYITWFITSVFGLAAYVYALVVTKAEVVGYLVFLMWLSLAQSAVSLFGATLQWFAWVSLIVAALSQLALPHLTKYIGSQLSTPFWVSSLFLVPIAVIVSWSQVLSGSMELWQLGVSLGLGGLYCLTGLYSVRKLTGSMVSADAYALSAHIFLLLGALAITYDQLFQGWQFGYMLLILSVAHLVWWIALRLRPSYAEITYYERMLFGVTIALAFISLPWLADYDMWFVVLGAVVTTIICVIMTYESKSQVSALFGTIAALALPVLITQAAVGFDDTVAPAFLAVSYLVVALCFAGLRVLIRAEEQLTAFPLAGYVMATGIAWLASASIATSGYYVQLGVMLGVLVVAVAASYLERIPRASAIIPIVFLTIVYSALDYFFTMGSQDNFVWAMGVTSAATYIYSLAEREVRGVTLLYVAITASAITWLASMSLSGDTWDIISPCIGAWLAALVYIEKPRLRGNAYFELLPVFIGTVAAVQLLDRMIPDVHSLVYSHIWAAYSGFVWYTLVRNNALKDNISAAMYVTLFILTAPLVILALSDNATYSPFLLIQQSIVLMIGLLFQVRPMSYWAATVMISVVIYALRSFGYLQLVIIAVLLIGYALYRLLNQHENK